MAAEAWSPIAGYEGLYEVSSHGRVRSLDRVVTVAMSDGSVHLRRMRSVLRRLRLGTTGYHQVSLWKDGITELAKVSHLVAEAFIGPRPPGLDTCHNDGNRLNDFASNLRYDTRRANCWDRRAHGTEHIGEQNPRARLTKSQISEIRIGRRKESSRVLAAEYGVSAGHIKNIRCSRCWRD